MPDTLKGIQFKSLDEARELLKETGTSGSHPDILDDGGDEPQGLLSVIPEDRLPEEKFFRLFDHGKGTLVELERIEYAGYGPPAEEADYMGFVSEQCAYVLAGRSYSIHIQNCPYQARDLHHLEAQILDREHPLNREYVAETLQLDPDWDFDDLFELVASRAYTAEQLDRIIHQGIQ